MPPELEAALPWILCALAGGFFGWLITLLALSGRIFVDETLEATPEAVLRQIWEDHFLLQPAAAEPG